MTPPLTSLSRLVSLGLFMAWIASPMAVAVFQGRIDDSTCDSTEAQRDCESHAQFPAECADLVALTAHLRRGAFKPSLPQRWEKVAAEQWIGAADRTYLSTPNDRCDIVREDASSLMPDRFKEEYYEKRPVIIRHATDPRLFASVTEKRVLLYCFGDFDVTLSTANKNSYDKFESSLRHYVGQLMEPQTLNASGVGTKYFFGDNRHDEWKAVFQHYAMPSQYIWSHVSLSFGMGGSGSGVPFHTHGAVFADVMHGEKRWFLQAPGPEPRFDPDESSLRWAKTVFPNYTKVERSAILDCVVSTGEFIYIPSHWHHATLNIGQTVFMSAFV